MVALDAERAPRRIENRHLARGVGLDPDRGLRGAGVAKERAEDELRHPGDPSGATANVHRVWRLQTFDEFRAGRQAEHAVALSSVAPIYPRTSILSAAIPRRDPALFQHTERDQRAVSNTRGENKALRVPVLCSPFAKGV